MRRPAFTARKVVHVVRSQRALVLALKVGLAVANVGAAIVTIDLLKNGVSILAGVIPLNNSTPTSGLNGVISDANMLLGDVLELNIVATAGGGTIGKGFFAELTMKEGPQHQSRFPICRQPSRN
jgi:hypothetical protein